MKNKGNFLKNSIVLITIMLFVFASIASARIQAPDSSITEIQKTQTNQPREPDYRTQIFLIPSYLNKDTQTQNINKQFTKGAEINLEKNIPISSLTITGEVALYKKDSLVRVILTDQNNNQYLVYEDYPLISQLGNFQITGLCEETCSLENIIPKSLQIQTKNAKITIKEIKYSTQPNKVYEPFKTQAKTNTLEKQNQFKINQINSNKDLRWTAGLTKVSQKTFQEKQLLCKDCPPEIFYYQGGIYNTQNPLETQENVEDSPAALTTTSEFPASWDWRNRHSQNWVTSVKDQSTCNSCSYFAATGAVEANVNLYFNQHLDLDISEQDIMSCGPGNCEYGASPRTVLKYYRDTGVTQEYCFPYSASDEDCSNKCSNWQDSIVKITNAEAIDTINQTWKDATWKNETWAKQSIIQKGILTSGILSWDHAMAIVGWNNDIDNKPIWIWKNSWGDDWGEDGFGNLKTPLTDIVGAHPIDYPYTIANQNPGIACTDNDNDGYCNWGLSETKPISCSISCVEQKDCDDSNEYLTYFEENYECHIVECYTDDECNFNPRELQQCQAGSKLTSCVAYRPQKCENNLCVPDTMASIGLEKYDSIDLDSPVPIPNPSHDKEKNKETIVKRQTPTQTKENTEKQTQQTIYLNKPTQSVETIYLSNSLVKTSFIQKLQEFF